MAYCVSNHCGLGLASLGGKWPRAGMNLTMRFGGLGWRGLGEGV